jgi:hypothetical protein
VKFDVCGGGNGTCGQLMTPLDSTDSKVNALPDLAVSAGTGAAQLNASLNCARTISPMLGAGGKNAIV